MALFESGQVKQLKEANENLAAENARLTEANAALTEAAGSSETLTAEVARLTEENAKLTTANEEIPALNELVETQKKEIGELTEKAKFTEEKVSAAAATKLTAMGHSETLEITEDVASKAASPLAGLTGMDKITASIKADREKQKI